MTWFKVGDELTYHPRVQRAGNAAIGLWVRAGTFCSEHLTDGWISHEDARTIGSAAEIKKLVAVGLWAEEEREGQRGYQFFRWASNHLGQPRQPSRAEVEKKRREAADRQAKHRARRANEGQDSQPAVTSEDAVTNASVTRDSRVSHTTPDPTRPGPSSSPSEREISDEISPRDARASEPKVVVTEGEWAKWWDTYPRRAGKDRAKPAYKRARQRGATAAQLLAGAARYRDDENRDPAFTQLPTTWLNAGGWDDEPLPPRDAAPATRTDEVARMREAALAQLDGIA